MKRWKINFLCTCLASVWEHMKQRDQPQRQGSFDMMSHSLSIGQQFRQILCRILDQSFQLTGIYDTKWKFKFQRAINY